jgi:hypothetical protein
MVLLPPVPCVILKTKVPNLGDVKLIVVLTLRVTLNISALVKFRVIFASLTVALIPLTGLLQVAVVPSVNKNFPSFPV